MGSWTVSITLLRVYFQFSPLLCPRRSLSYAFGGRRLFLNSIAVNRIQVPPSMLNRGLQWVLGVVAGSDCWHFIPHSLRCGVLFGFTEGLGGRSWWWCQHYKLTKIPCGQGRSMTKEGNDQKEQNSPNVTNNVSKANYVICYAISGPKSMII